MENEPAPLTADQRYVLGWEAATQRLIESAKVTVKEARRRRRELDEVISGLGGPKEKRGYMEKGGILQ